MSERTCTCEEPLVHLRPSGTRICLKCGYTIPDPPKEVPERP